MRPERTCLDCGAAARKGQRSDYCESCRQSRCQHCKCRLPGRKPSRNLLCTPCRKERDHRYSMNPGRRCSACLTPLPLGRVQSDCAECCRQRQARYIAGMASNTQRACVDCRQPVGEKRTTPRCKACHKSFRERCRQRPGRRCSICQGHLTAKDDSRCADCLRLYQNWRADYRRGTPEARLLGHIRTNNRYAGQ